MKMTNRQIQTSWGILAVILLILILLCICSHGFTLLGIPGFGDLASSSDGNGDGGDDGTDGDNGDDTGTPTTPDTPDDGDDDDDDGGDDLPQGWVQCSEDEGSRDCVDPGEEIQVAIDMGTTPTNREYRVEIERWWEGAGCCDYTPDDGGYDGYDGDGDYEGDDGQYLIVDDGYDDDWYDDGCPCPDPCAAPVEWKLYDSDPRIQNWWKQDNSPVDTFGSPDTVTNMNYDGMGWTIWMKNGCDCYINMEWRVVIYQWVGLENAPDIPDNDNFEIPGFEMILFVLTVSLALMIWYPWKQKQGRKK